MLEKVCELVEKQGIEAWFSLDVESFLENETAEFESNNSPVHNYKNYKKVTDTLDVWFDSGATHAAVLKRRPELAFPADLYLEGSDQHRGWFQSSLLTGCAIDGRAPYDALLTHGFVVDGSGHKMSKSKGNVVAPQKVMDTYGADILRLWVASTDYSGELTISDEILKRVAESYRRIRNTLRFLLANLADFDAGKDLLPVNEWLEIDRYALALTEKLQTTTGIMSRVSFAAYHSLILCRTRWFLPADEDRLTGREEFTCTDLRGVKRVLHHITHAMMRLMAPILSFTADEIWQTLKVSEETTVFEEEWYQLPAHGLDTSQINKWGFIRNLREQELNKLIENERSAGNVGSSLEAEVDIYASGVSYDGLSSLGDELKFVLLVSRATVHQRAGALEVQVTPSSHVKCDRCWHYRADVGSDAEHPHICGRCVSNLFGKGGARSHA